MSSFHVLAGMTGAAMFGAAAYLASEAANFKVTMTDADPYRSEPKQYYLITYSMEFPGGRSTPSYFNAVIEGSPMEWFVREVEAALRPMPPYPPGSGVPRSLIYAPPPRPPVLLSAWPITETQFEKLRPVFYGGKVER